jgi:hypothetical protein
MEKGVDGWIMDRGPCCSFLERKINNKNVMRWCKTNAKIQGNARLEREIRKV